MRSSLLLVIFWVWVSTAWATVPEQLHYNGYLTNAVGEGVDCPDAVQCPETFNLTFRLYDAEDSDAALWEETHEAVAFYGGSFHAALGSLTPITPETVNGPTWLAIQINDHPEMEPRQKIVSSAYALRAGSAEQATEALNATQLGGVDAANYATQEAVTEIESSLSPVATEGLPEELADGDDDTLAALGCVADQIPKWDGAAWACAEDVDTDTSIDDTTLDEAQVDAMVANNGYASEGSVTDVQATLANVQSDLNNAQAALTTLQGNLDATGVTVNDHGLNITALQAELNQLQSNLTLVQANLDAEALARSDADTSLDQAITDEAVQRIADDGALQGQVDAIAADLNSTVTGLSVVATTGSYTDLSDTPTDSDTLSGLECETGQLPKWDGSAWACAEDTNTNIADTNTQLTEAEVDAFVANNDYATGAHTVDTNTQLTEAEVDAFVANNDYATGAHTVDTNTQLTEAEVDAFVANNDYATGDHTVDTDTQLTEAEVDAFVANNDFSTGAHTVDTNTQLTEAEVDAFVANNDYATGAHTVDTNTQLTEAEVDAFVANNDFSTGDHTVDTNTQLTSSQVHNIALAEGFVTGAHTTNTNTQLNEAEVDAFVANNGFASQTGLDSVQANLTTAQTAINDLETSLTNLTSTSGTDITALQGSVSDLQTALNTVQDNIDDEATSRTSADTTLQSNIDAEATSRTSADTTLQSNIDAEATSRTSADTTLQSNIDAETTARASADTTLQSNIDLVGPHLTEAEVDAFVANNDYSTGDHTVDTLSVLNSCDTDQIIAWDGSAWVCSDKTSPYGAGKSFVNRKAEGGTYAYPDFVQVAEFLPLKEGNHLTPTKITLQMKGYGAPWCTGHTLEGYYKTYFADGTSLQSDTYNLGYVLDYDTVHEEEIPLLDGMRNTIIRLEFWALSSVASCVAYGQFIVSGFESEAIDMAPHKHFVNRKAEGGTYAYPDFVQVAEFLALKEGNHLTPTKITLQMKGYGAPWCTGHTLEGYYKTYFADGTSLQSDTYNLGYILNYDTVHEEEIPLLDGMRNTIVRLEFWALSSVASCVAYGQFIVSGFETPP